MAATLTGILASAERIGKATAALLLAKNGEEILKYQTEESLVQQCIRNEFQTLVTTKYNCHTATSHDILLQLTNDALRIESWTLGAECAWFVGELNGNHYSVYFKPSRGCAKLGYLRITVDEIGHQCLDCT
jgi:hypothetical protein